MKNHYELCDSCQKRVDDVPEVRTEDEIIVARIAAMIHVEKVYADPECQYGGES